MSIKYSNSIRALSLHLSRFKLKLHKIVQEEQGANFITRLYRGRLDIIPWPVIESRQFYTLFMTLKKRLDGQSCTHEGGGAFLHKLKMLMAKLKVRKNYKIGDFSNLNLVQTNDWGSLSRMLFDRPRRVTLTKLSGQRTWRHTGHNICCPCYRGQ